MTDIVKRLRDACIGGDSCRCSLREAADEIERMRGLLCRCDLRTRLVGDGCEFCNPALAAELAADAARERGRPRRGIVRGAR